MVDAEKQLGLRGVGTRVDTEGEEVTCRQQSIGSSLRRCSQSCPELGFPSRTISFSFIMCACEQDKHPWELKVLLLSLRCDPLWVATVCSLQTCILCGISTTSLSKFWELAPLCPNGRGRMVRRVWVCS